jgi:anaerobic magnesium-protoporphyrin IX monomethyl ester cyclase
MRIQIVNPNLSGDVSILDIGQTYLTTYLKERTRHDAATMDFTFHRKDWRQYLRRSLDRFEPDVLGLSATSLYMGYVSDIIAEAKARRPDLRVIMGGWHCSLLPDDSIGRQHVEAIVLGDGEYTSEAYLDALDEQRPLDGITGLWFKDARGEIVRNEKRRFVENVDELPIPDYDVWEDIEKYVFYNQMLYMMGNRGCPYACSYCSEVSLRKAIPGKGIRRRSPRPLAREIQHHYAKYKDAGMRIAHFFDPVFSFNLPWTREFCDEYRKIGMAEQLPFSCFAAGANLDEERVEALAAANCQIIRIGIEAGNERIRQEVYHKKVSNAQLAKIFKLCHDRGIHITGYNMIGGPGEDFGTLMDTFNLVRELKVERPIFFTYRPLPATRGAELVEEMGGKVLTEGWDKIDSLHTHGNVETAKLKPWQIEWFRNFCLAYFNLSRTARLILDQKHRFFINLAEYIYRGIQDGVGMQYVIGYFMVCAGDNLTN